MKTFIIAFFASVIPMVLLDGAWLTIMADRLYRPRIGQLMAESFLITPGIIFYVLYGVGLTVLVIFPALSGNMSLGKVFLYGALLGLVAYGTYDLTNHATLKEWSTLITVVDMIWGALLTGGIATLAVSITRYFS